MILGERVLFVHVPKTGGMAVTTYLLATLPRPIRYVHPDHDPALDAGVIQLAGIRHETLAESFTIADSEGIDPWRLPLVVAVVRNPYALEVSRFAYLQKGFARDAGHNQDLALAGDFTAFATQSVNHGGTERPIEAYFEINGRIPPNMRILRQESLHVDLPQALRDAGIAVPPSATLVVENDSRHGPWLDYYTCAAAEAVTSRYRWVFDHGFYERLDPTTLPDRLETPFHGLTVATSGPMFQAGPIVGMWHDGWAGQRVAIPLAADGHVSRIVIQCHAPHVFSDGLLLTITAGDARTRHDVTSTRPFSISVPAIARPGDRLGLVLEASASFRPQDEGGSDARELSYILFRIDAEASP